MRATKVAFWCALIVMATAGAAPAETMDRADASGPSRAGKAARYAYFEIDGLIRESLPRPRRFAAPCCGAVRRARTSSAISKREATSVITWPRPAGESCLRRQDI